MSGFTRETGKVELIGEMTPPQAENFLKKYFESECMEEDKSRYSYWIERCNDYFFEHGIDKTFIYTPQNKKLWLVTTHKKDDIRYHYCDLKPTCSGYMEFDTTYHNGGTCWQEMLEDELSKL